MLFQTLSFAVAALCLAKGTLALTQPGFFYRFRQSQYAAAHLPLTVLVVPGFILLLTGLAWYATFTASMAWGWVLTGFLSSISVMAAANLLRWSQHRQHLYREITEKTYKRRRVDQALLGIGSFFLLMGLLVY